MEITIKHLKKNHQARQILAITDYTFESGAIHQLSGANGAGKSTLFEILALLDEEYEGTVCFDGKDIRQIRRDGTTVTSVFQKPVMLHRSVRENLKYPLRLKHLEDPLIEKRLGFYLDCLPLGDLLEEKATHLSLGEAQKVSLIRGLAMHTPILLLDEPFSAMDRLSRERSLEMILEHQKQTGATIILISHRELEHSAMRQNYLEGGSLTR